MAETSGSALRTLFTVGARLSLAAALTTAAFVLKTAFAAYLGPPYILFYPAIMLAAVVGGLAPGLLATALSALYALRYVLPSAGTSAAMGTPERVSFATFVAMGVFMSLVGGLYRRERSERARLALERTLREGEERARRRAEEAQRRYELLADHARDVILFVRVDDGRILDANAAAASTYGYTADELRALTIAELRAHHDAGRVARDLAAADREGHRFETIHRRKDGTTFPVEVSAQGVTVGDTRMVLSIVRDVTERKEAERRLEAERERLAVTLKSIGDAVIATDRDARVTTFNDVAARLTGWPAAEALGRPLAEVFRIVSEDDRRPLESPVERVLREGRVVGLANHTALLARDGGERPIADSGAPIRDAEGRVVGVVLVFRDQTEERRAEDELRAGEQRLRLALEAARAGSWEWDLRTNRNTWSDGLWELYGLERDGRDASYQAWRDSIHPDDRARVEQTVADAARLGTELNVEWRVAHPDGPVRWLASRGRPLREADGAFRRFLGIVIDVTREKQAEEALRESERRFRMALRNSPVTVALQDRDLRYVWAYNQRTTRPDEVLGHGDDNLFPPEEAAHLRALKQRVLDEGVELREQLTLTRPGGTVYLDTYLEPVRDAAGRVTGVGVATVNLTPEKRAAAEVREREERLAVTLRSIADAVIATDEAGRVTVVNQVAEALTGWPAAEAIGRPLGEVFRVIGERSRQEVASPVERVLREGAPVGLANGALLVARDGAERPIAERGAPIRDAAGAIRGVVLVFRDETAERDAERIRREAEERLAASERRYRLLADHAHDVIWTLDLATGRYTYISPSIRELRGLTVEEALAEPLERSLTPESLARVQATMARIGTPEEQDPGTDVYDQPCKDGSVKHVEITTSLVRDGAGRPVEVVGVSRDATARVEAQRALGESEALYRSLFQLAPSGVVLVDRDGAIVAFNDQACRQLGYAREEFARLRVSDIDVQEVRPGDVAAHLDRIAAGGPEEFEALHRTRSGEVRAVLVSSRHVTVGGQSRFLAIWQDVTDRRRAEEALRRSEERFRALIEKSTDLIVVVGADGKKRFWSQGATETLGWRPEEMLGRPALELIHPDDRPRAAEALTRLLSRQGHVWSDLLRFRHKDGSWRYVEATARDLLADPSVEGVVVNARDVSAQRLLEEQFRQAQKLESVGRLAGGVAHDFNNLLTVILSCTAELDLALSSGQAASADDVREIDAAARRAAELTAQLLAFARKQMIAPVALDLGQVVRGSERMLRRLLGEDVALRVELQPDLWTTRADPGQLSQVIVNLAVNARDAMPTGGTLLLRVSNFTVTPALAATGPEHVVGDWVQLSISDSGSGMTAEVRAHLFEPFFTTKEQGKGTGLGLATVYGIVQQAGGHIHVASQVGRGSTFEVRFPRVAAAAAAADTTPGADVGVRGGAERILLVEDDDRVRAVTARTLRAAGYDVLALASPREALELPRQRSCEVQLLVTDVVMPGVDGRALAQELRRRHPALRVLFLSGYTPDTIAERGAIVPEGELLPKPFTGAALLDKVRAMLDAGAIAGRAAPAPAPGSVEEHAQSRTVLHVQGRQGDD